MTPFCSQQAYSWRGAIAGLESREDGGSCPCLRGRIPVTDEEYRLPGLEGRITHCMRREATWLQRGDTGWFSSKTTWLQVEITRL